jgi:putative ABC transport system permease protein
VWEHLRLVAGRLPANDDEHVVVIGTLAADILKKTVGSPIRLESGTFTICGIFDSASLLEKGAVITSLGQLQRITEKSGQVNFLNLKLTPGMTTSDIDRLRSQLMGGWPGFKAYTVGEVVENNTAMKVAKAVSWATSAIALVVGALGVMNTMLMSVFERMHEIGILLAIGWRRRRIVLMILYESIALSLAGGIVGILVGAAAVQLLELTPLLRGKVEGEFSGSLYGVAFMISIGLGVMSGIYPAYRGSRMQPSDALRYE